MARLLGMFGNSELGIQSWEFRAHECTGKRGDEENICGEKSDRGTRGLKGLEGFFEEGGVYWERLGAVGGDWERL